jgi:hypothetical protein
MSEVHRKRISWYGCASIWIVLFLVSGGLAAVAWRYFGWIGSVAVLSGIFSLFAWIASTPSPIRHPPVPKETPPPLPIPSLGASEEEWAGYLDDLLFDRGLGLSTYDRDASLQLANGVLAALKSKLGDVEMGLIDTQDRSDYAHYSFEKRWRRNPENPYAALVLSQYGQLTSLFCEGDFTAEAIQLIQDAVMEAGCHYVPFRVFAYPEHFEWKTGRMKREDLWRSFFDYE